MRIIHIYDSKEDFSSFEQKSLEDTPPAKKQKKNQPTSDKDSFSNNSSNFYFSSQSESDTKKKKKKIKKLKSDSTIVKQIHYAKKAKKLEKKLNQEGYRIIKLTAYSRVDYSERSYYY